MNAGVCFRDDSFPDSRVKSSIYSLDEIEKYEIIMGHDLSFRLSSKSQGNFYLSKFCPSTEYQQPMPPL
jgi:hypothetical protein